MAIEHADSFDIYGTDASFMLDGVYAQVSPGQFGGLVDDPDGLSTQRVFFFTSGVLRYALQTPTDVIGVSERVWMPQLPSDPGAEAILCYFADINNVDIAYLKVQTNGAVKFEVVDGSTYSTNVPVLTAEAWWHIECKIAVDTGGAGTFELRIEGQTVIDEDAIDFTAATIYQIKQGSETSGIGASFRWYLKDYVIWNDLGTDNTDFLGPVRVINLTPNADDDLGGWTPSTGTEGYPILDNNPPLNTEYMIGTPAAVDDPMAYDLTSLPDDITAIKGVLTFVRARKIDGGYGALQTSMIGTGDVESPGADRPITAGYVYWRDVHERDPGTDAPWTRVAVNASKIKIDRTL